MRAVYIKVLTSMSSMFVPVMCLIFNCICMPCAFSSVTIPLAWLFDLAWIDLCLE